jgi:predicted RNA-binding Zn-ribbon protein involved in translation (DUF1610 family)
MDESDPRPDQPQLECPKCGAPTTRTRASDFDDVGPRRVEYECPNHHRTIVERVETYDDDPDLPYNER